jgi:hypothetical protein
MAALLCVPVAGTAVAAWFLPTLADAAVLLATVAASAVALIKVVNPAGKGATLAAACALGAAATMVFAVPLLILRARGEHAVATVIAEGVADSRTGPTYKYRLATADGRKIPGELSEPVDEFSAGDQVRVVFDPRGVANPHDDDFVGVGLPLTAGALALLLTGVALTVPATASARSRG